MRTASPKFPTFLGLLLRNVDLSCCSRPRSHCLLTHVSSCMCFLPQVFFGCNDRFLLIGSTKSSSPLLLLLQPSGAKPHFFVFAKLLLQPIGIWIGEFSSLLFRAIIKQKTELHWQSGTASIAGASVSEPHTSESNWHIYLFWRTSFRIFSTL